jgi:hypothetical protein
MTALHLGVRRAILSDPLMLAFVSFFCILAMDQQFSVRLSQLDVPFYAHVFFLEDSFWGRYIHPTDERFSSICKHGLHLLSRDVDT